MKNTPGVLIDVLSSKSKLGKYIIPSGLYTAPSPPVSVINMSPGQDVARG